MSDIGELSERVEFLEGQFHSLEAQIKLLKKASPSRDERIVVGNEDENSLLESIRFVNTYKKDDEPGALKSDVIGAAFTIGVSPYGIRDRLEALRQRGLITAVTYNADEPGSERYIVNDELPEGRQ